MEADVEAEEASMTVDVGGVVVDVADEAALVIVVDEVVPEVAVVEARTAEALVISKARNRLLVKAKALGMAGACMPVNTAAHIFSA